MWANLWIAQRRHPRTIVVPDTDEGRNHFALQCDRLMKKIDHNAFYQRLLVQCVDHVCIKSGIYNYEQRCSRWSNPLWQLLLRYRRAIKVHTTSTLSTFVLKERYGKNYFRLSRHRVTDVGSFRSWPAQKAGTDSLRGIGFWKELYIIQTVELQKW